MDMKIVVSISPTGEVIVSAENGVQGEACSLAVRNMAAALGVIVEEEHLPEFYGRTAVTHQTRVEGSV